MKQFGGSVSSKRIISEQVASRKVVLYLKARFEFEVNDINYGDKQYNEWHFNQVDKAYQETLLENIKLKGKIVEYEHLLVCTQILFNHY